jgi:hypothetical protein
LTPFAVLAVFALRPIDWRPASSGVESAETPEAEARNIESLNQEGELPVPLAPCCG